MARKKIREYDSKRLLKAHILRLKIIKLPLNVTQVSRAKAPSGRLFLETVLMPRCAATSITLHSNLHVSWYN